MGTSTVERIRTRLLSAFENGRDVRTVCLMLGPYRNLTTLTASMLSLHENVQVLNHAGDEIFGQPRLNFVSDNDPRTFDRFIRFALASSTRKATGQVGGAITSSHAFKRERMREAYAKRFGAENRKQQVFSLVWKESLRTSIQLRRSPHSTGEILDRHPRIRFLMPVRNPLDCARSNMKTGHLKLFPDLTEDSSEERVLQAVLAEIRWFMELHSSYPNRFFYYFQNEFDADTASALGDFLELPRDQTWIEAAVSVYTLEGSYEHSSAILNFYRDEVQATFADLPRERDVLLGFSQRIRA